MNFEKSSIDAERGFVSFGFFFFFSAGEGRDGFWDSRDARMTEIRLAEITESVR